MKFATFIAAESGAEAGAFHQWLLQAYAASFVQAADGLISAVIRLSVETPTVVRTSGATAKEPEAAHLPYHALLESWFATTEDFRKTARKVEPMLRQRGARFVSYRVTPWLEKDPRQAEAGPDGTRPALTLITPVKWLPGLAKSEARRHWDEHVGTALRVHVGLSKYERNWAEEIMSWSDGAEPVDAYADFSFRTIEDYTDRFFPDDGDRLEISQDIANFIASGSVLLLGDARPIGG
ncbi:MAG: hypothetical protein AB7G25_14435 [Sphingomonadaceae bacterium]